MTLLGILATKNDTIMVRTGEELSMVITVAEPAHISVLIFYKI